MRELLSWGSAFTIGFSLNCCSNPRVLKKDDAFTIGFSLVLLLIEEFLGGLSFMLIINLRFGVCKASIINMLERTIVSLAFILVIIDNTA